MIETAALATYVVGSFLVPLAKKGAEKLTEELSQASGSAAAEGLVGVAKKLWSRVRGKTEGTDDQPMVELFEQQPEKMKATLETIVRELLERDPELRKEVSGLLEGQEAGSTRWQLMGDYVGAFDGRGAHISGGQNAGVIVGSPVQPKTRPDPVQPT